MTDEMKEPANKDLVSPFQSPTAKDECSSCLSKLQGRYCHVCGQVSDEYHRPIWFLFADIFDGLFGVDGRIWKTILPLMLRPGEVTNAYLRGTREPYIQPFKLFLLASILFFLVFALFSSNTEDERGIIYIASSEEEKVETICHLRGMLVPERLTPTCKQLILAHAIKNSDVSLQNIAAIIPGNIDMANTDFIPNSPPTWLNFATRTFLMTKTEAVVNDPIPSQKAMVRWAPRLVFALVPVYGLLLALMFFWHKKLYFYDHMIVALHFHAVLFFSLTIFILFVSLINPLLPSILLIGYSNYYLVQIHRKVYQCTWPTAILRTAILDTVYMVVLIIGLFILMILGVLLA